MENHVVLTLVIVGGIIAVVLGIIIRAALNAENPPAWASFLARRKAEGKSTQWKEWKDED
jgi:hypothetical protein